MKCKLGLKWGELSFLIWNPFLTPQIRRLKWYIFLIVQRLWANNNSVARSSVIIHLVLTKWEAPIGPFNQIGGSHWPIYSKRNGQCLMIALLKRIPKRRGDCRTHPWTFFFRSCVRLDLKNVAMSLMLSSKFEMLPDFGIEALTQSESSWKVDAMLNRLSRKMMAPKSF